MNKNEMTEVYREVLTEVSTILGMPRSPDLRTVPSALRSKLADLALAERSILNWEKAAFSACAGIVGTPENPTNTPCQPSLLLRLRSETRRLKQLIDRTGQSWLALEPGLAWEGAIDSAMDAAVSAIRSLRDDLEHERTEYAETHALYMAASVRIDELERAHRHDREELGKVYSQLRRLTAVAGCRATDAKHDTEEAVQRVMKVRERAVTAENDRNALRVELGKQKARIRRMEEKIDADERRCEEDWAKLEVNKGRVWQAPNADGSVEHVRDEAPARHDLVVMDEAPGIPQDVFDAMKRTEYWQSEAVRQQELVTRLVEERGESVWLWQGDGGDDVQSLTCPVLMSADQARQMVSKREAAEAKLAEAILVKRHYEETVCLPGSALLLECGGEAQGISTVKIGKLLADLDAARAQVTPLVESFGVKPLGDLNGELTQIDNGIVGLREQISEHLPDHCYRCEKPCKYAGQDPSNGAERCAQCLLEITKGDEVLKLAREIRSKSDRIRGWLRWRDAWTGCAAPVDHRDGTPWYQSALSGAYPPRGF